MGRDATNPRLPLRGNQSHYGADGLQRDEAAAPQKLEAPLRNNGVVGSRRRASAHGAPSRRDGYGPRTQALQRQGRIAKWRAQRPPPQIQLLRLNGRATTTGGATRPRLISSQIMATYSWSGAAHVEGEGATFFGVRGLGWELLMRSKICERRSRQRDDRPRSIRHRCSPEFQTEVCRSFHCAVTRLRRLGQLRALPSQQPKFRKQQSINENNRTLGTLHIARLQVATVIRAPRALRDRKRRRIFLIKGQIIGRVPNAEQACRLLRIPPEFLQEFSGHEND